MNTHNELKMKSPWRLIQLIINLVLPCLADGSTQVHEQTVPEETNLASIRQTQPG
jgi:hypothetical protein